MTRGKRVSLACLLALMGAVSALVFASVAVAATVTTTGGVVGVSQSISGPPGQATCKSQGDSDAVVVIEFTLADLQYALNNPATGKTLSSGGFTVTVFATDPNGDGIPNSVSFTSSGTISSAFVHAGGGSTAGTFFDYSSAAASVRVADSGLQDTDGQNLSSISFCFDAGSALGVQFRSLKALAAKSGVLVRWATGTEVDVLGFNVYREVKGLRVKANKSLIVAKAGTTGHSYSWLDRAAKKSNRYWVQAVNGNGTRSWVGPARVARA